MDAAGIPINRVHHVIVTHSHPDHFGGAGMLAEESGADIVASSFFRTWFDPTDNGDERELGPARLEPLDPAEEDEERLGERFALPSPWGGDSGRLKGEEREVVMARRQEMFSWFRIPRPSVHLDDADRITLAGREWVGVYTPGHTNDHLCLFDPEEGVLLSGDHVLPTITPHISGLIEGDPLQRLPRVARPGGRLRGRHHRAAGPRSPVPRPARPGRRHQGAPRRTARPVAPGLRARGAGPPSTS